MDLALHDIRYAFDSEVLTLHENAFDSISLSLHDELFLRPGDVFRNSSYRFYLQLGSELRMRTTKHPGQSPHNSVLEDDVYCCHNRIGWSIEREDYEAPSLIKIFNVLIHIYSVLSATRKKVK